MISKAENAVFQDTQSVEYKRFISFVFPTWNICAEGVQIRF